MTTKSATLLDNSIKSFVNGAWNTARMENVLHVPGLKKNLFSVGACTRKGLRVIFDKNRVNFMKRDAVVASGVIQDNNIYRMFFRVTCLKKTEKQVRPRKIFVCGTNV